VSFPKPENDQELEALLTETFGPPPRADIDAWRTRYPSALAWLNPQRISALAMRRKRMQRIMILATTTAAALCIWLGLSHFAANDTGASAFAQAVAQIEKAKTITWKKTCYDYLLHKNGKGTWVKMEEENAYKAPDLYRRVTASLAEKEEGQERFVEITDLVHQKGLELWLRRKKAVLTDLTDGYKPNGPFDYSVEEMKGGDLQWVGRRKTVAGEVNVFRQSSGSGKHYWSFDLWIDPKTKQLVGEQIPGADIYDPDSDPGHDNPIGGRWPNGSPHCCIVHNIDFDAKLDDSLFSLTPPEGYTLTVQHRNYVTEREMIDYLGALADVNDKTFPGQRSPSDIGSISLDDEHRGQIYGKPLKKRTAAELKLSEIVGHYIQAHLNHMPIYHFITDNAVEGSFRYLGKGVKLGDKSAIVCWYKLKNAADPNAYRVVYGDLSVKDLAAKDLPLPVEP
jgi:hypothetical protein